MKSSNKNPNRKSAFTIVELLTIMSIIVILFSLLVPSLGLARKYAKKVKQKNQFRSISIGLELFRTEEDGYPESTVLGTAAFTTGAHHLAEALVGRDLQGFDPVSSWDAADDATSNPLAYATAPPAEALASLNRRKGPFLQLENIGVFQIEDLYGNTGTVYDGNDPPAPVLTDVYRVKKVSISATKTLKAGAPILYYKADTASNIFKDLAYTTDKWIFNSEDNQDLIELGQMMDQTQMHYFDPAYTDGILNGTELFYEAITNLQVRNIDRPFNRDSYILLSAGFDGIYGTDDDVFNFGD